MVSTTFSQDVDNALAREAHGLGDHRYFRPFCVAWMGVDGVVPPACCCQGFLLLGYDQGVMSGIVSMLSRGTVDAVQTIPLLDWREQSVWP